MNHLRHLTLVLLLTLAAIPLFSVGAASATTLEIGGVAQNKSVEYSLSLEPGTSVLLKDEAGTTTDTCTSSTIKGNTEGSFTGETVGGKLSTLTLSGCTHTTIVIKLGRFSKKWTFGTEAEVSSAELEVTVASTFFGASAVCKTGAGTVIGFLVGKKSGRALLKLLSKINCGILGNSTLSGTYLYTSPEGLGAVS